LTRETVSLKLLARFMQPFDPRGAQSAVFA
jgi:hypothetical protein